jgi:hypothetical protein
MIYKFLNYIFKNVIGLNREIFNFRSHDPAKTLKEVGYINLHLSNPIIRRRFLDVFLENLFQ